MSGSGLGACAVPQRPSHPRWQSSPSPQAILTLTPGNHPPRQSSPQATITPGNPHPRQSSPSPQAIITLTPGNHHPRQSSPSPQVADLARLETTAQHTFLIGLGWKRALETPPHAQATAECAALGGAARASLVSGGPAPMEVTAESVPASRAEATAGGRGRGGGKGAGRHRSHHGKGGRS